MTDPTRPPPGFVVMHQTDNDRWRLVGEVDRRPDATGGEAKPGDVCAAILGSEWRIALEN